MKINVCKFCGTKNIEINCPHCFCITPIRKTIKTDINSTFTDYSYNRYYSGMLKKLYAQWMRLSGFLFTDSSLKSRMLNLFFAPVLGGRPYIKFAKHESLLDVGCGKGSFLETLPNNWHKLGCDIVNYGIRNKNIRIGNFETMRFNKKYSIVRSSHSIEHSQNPKIFLQKMINLTAKKGYIILLTPNALSFSSILFKKSWITLNVESHFCILNPGVIERFLEDNNCKVIYRNTYTLFSAGGSMAHLLSKNNSFLLFILSSILFLPLTIVELLFGKGDSFVLYAKKMK